MANGGFRWRFEVKQMLKLVRVTGIATTVDEDNQALLILQGLQFLTLAEKKKGVVLPLTVFRKQGKMKNLSTLKSYFIVI